MIRLCLVLILSASVFSESQARETETWMPMSTTQTVAMAINDDDQDGSGNSSNDFAFIETDDEDDDEDYDTEYDESSGSGDEETTDSSPGESTPSVKSQDNNWIPELKPTVRPTVNEVDVVRNENEIHLGSKSRSNEQNPSNVLMSQATGGSIFNKTEVLAALIAGGAVGLMFAVLLILLLIYRMKKKDEGSYDLGKKPIYKKAPTTEIYA